MLYRVLRVVGGPFPVSVDPEMPDVVYLFHLNSCLNVFFSVPLEYERERKREARALEASTALSSRLGSFASSLVCLSFPSLCFFAGHLSLCFSSSFVCLFYRAVPDCLVCMFALWHSWSLGPGALSSGCVANYEDVRGSTQLAPSAGVVSQLWRWRSGRP